MDTVLDLDLDFFVWPIAYHRSGKRRLPDRACTHLASEHAVRDFLEQRLHLSRLNPLPGREFAEHQEAFRVWRSWVEEKKLRAPFALVHVDAHADLGAGGLNQTCSSVAKLLQRAVDRRSHPRFGPRGANSSNYLAFAIANRWVAHLTYVVPTVDGKAPQGDLDLPPWCFRDNDWRTGLIELKTYGQGAFMLRNPVPTHVEPSVPFDLAPVPFNLMTSGKFERDGFTHMVLAHSRPYTPLAADRLLPVIREYFAD